MRPQPLRRGSALEQARYAPGSQKRSEMAGTRTKGHRGAHSPRLTGWLDRALPHLTVDGSGERGQLAPEEAALAFVAAEADGERELVAGLVGAAEPAEELAADARQQV